MVAGLATQYLPNSTFGSLSDYAGLLVWATAATAAGQIAKVVATARATTALQRRVPVASSGMTVDHTEVL